MSSRYEWQPTKSYVAMSGKVIFLVQPSAKYPGCWWAVKIEAGVWEGFNRPFTQKGFDLWQEMLPDDLRFASIKEWDGEELTLPVIENARKSLSDCVYFIEADGLSRVKIGLCSGDPASRLSQIQQISPVELRVIGTIPGDRKTEQALHSRFASTRIHGEWFEFSDELREYINLNCKEIQ